MAKARPRSTCTECSLRRQRCDRQSPCGRCVKRGIPDKCQLNWQKGRYAPAMHRAYPSRAPQLITTPPPSGSVEQFPGSDSQRTETAAEVQELWHFAEPDTSRPQYVFTPYEPVRLRKMAAEFGHGADTSLFSSMGARLDWGSQPAPAMHEPFLQMLLPSSDRIWKLVDYHEKYLLWYHCCYHGPTFRSELESVIAEQDDKTTLVVSGLHMQWLALLFSIMAGTLTCSSEWRLRDWGFSKAEADQLSTAWYRAAILSLNQAQWTADHHVYSVQAVTVLTMSAHPLGCSAELSVLLGTTLKIAQTLGLDKINDNAALDNIHDTSSNEQRHRSIQRELGRKLWSQLCVQDWMSLPSTGSHNINPLHFATTKPSKRDHVTMNFLPATEPTYISYGNYVFDIAKLLVQHHEAMLQSTTAFTKYQHVLNYDTQMRNLATKAMPRYFHVMEPVNAAWPGWIHWARSSLTICFAHKIIMVHRAYIRQSFSDPLYAKTRITCTAAAKTILNEVTQAGNADGPIIWIDKAYCVAAAVILCLDVFHRPDSDPDLTTHKSLVMQCIEQLQSLGNGVIAARGARLLAEIMAERDRPDFVTGWPSQGVDFLDNVMYSSGERVGPTYQLSNESFPPQMGFDNKFLFNDLFGCNVPIIHP